MENFLKNMGALNDETRIRILRFIALNTEVCVCDIESAFEMIQSRISRHLKILKEAGFLSVDRRGKWAYYSLKQTLTTLQNDILKEVLSLDIKTPLLKGTCTMDRKVLVLCTGNSCRSIIAEALINKHLEGVSAQSSGVKASGKVNPNAKKLLEQFDEWDDAYHSKVLEEVINEDFDLVITVCDNAKESCPIFPKKVDLIHIGFEDPDGKDFEAFVKTREEIQEKLLPYVKAYVRDLACC